MRPSTVTLGQIKIRRDVNPHASVHKTTSDWWGQEVTFPMGKYSVINHPLWAFFLWSIWYQPLPETALWTRSSPKLGLIQPGNSYVYISICRPIYNSKFQWSRFVWIFLKLYLLLSWDTGTEPAHNEVNCDMRQMRPFVCQVPAWSSFYRWFINHL